MNHHSFRELVTKMPSDDIRANNMNPAHFKAVCFVLSMYGDYETGTSIRPSWLTVSREAGVDRKTAMKVRDYLLSVGALVKVRTNEANISVYEFGDKVDQLSNLEVQLSNSSEQMSTIVGQNTTIYSTNNTKSRSGNKEEVDKFLKGVFS